MTQIDGVSPLLASIKEAAAALDVSTQTLYRMRAAGEIRIVKIRGRSGVPIAELQRLASAGTQPAEGTPVRTPRKRRVKKVYLFPRDSL